MKTRSPAVESYDDVPLSALLQAARRTYTDAVDRAQTQAGYDDLPTTGNAIISTMSWSNASLDAVIRWMGASKQAVSQTVDTLVVRGYLERAHDPKDRRRVNLALTERGRAAGSVARSAIERLDQRVRKQLSKETITRTRATLVTLIELGRKPS
jgi:DNA-binding MarR family transcriptional regulator